MAYPRKSRVDEIVSDVYVDFEEFYDEYSSWQPSMDELTIPDQDPTETSELIPGTTTDMYYHCGDEVDTKRAKAFFSSNRKALERFKPSLQTERLISEFYQLLPHAVPGYSFRYRTWYLLDLDLVQHIKPDRYSGFDDLVIPNHYKELLTALVNNHISGVQKRKERLKAHGKAFEDTNIDVVLGKGEGLIILLHGPPGSGKTSTAETIAAYTKRPLYSITCGDIGLSPRDAEKNLKHHTFRADKWGCVLLLDEADVFLMQRTWKEIDRNALVSVFLRQLEYYSGILFLTTNRPGTIDEAFKSRIHVSLRYPSIDLNSTIKMWENILARLENGNSSAEIKVVFDRNKLLAFAEQHYKRRQASESMWNGRQIRNAFQAAIALGHAARQMALHEANISAQDAATHPNKRKWMTVKLTVSNFRRIARITNEFEDYIVALRGKDADAARDAEVRDDNYDPDVSRPGMKSYGQLSASMSSVSMSGGGGGGWGHWGGLAATGGGARAESISLEPSSSTKMNNRNVGKGKAPAIGRQTAVLSAVDSEEHYENDDDDDIDDDEGGLDGDN